MQLPPADEVVMLAGTPPVRAKKARYFEGKRLIGRVLSPPVCIADIAFKCQPPGVRPPRR